MTKNEFRNYIDYCRSTREFTFIEAFCDRRYKDIDIVQEVLAERLDIPALRPKLESLIMKCDS